MEDGLQHRHTRDIHPTRRPTSIIIGSWVAVVWAATLAYSAVSIEISSGRTQLPGGSATRLDWLIFAFKMLAALAVSIWVMIAAVGMLRLKRWARYWLFVVAALICVGKAGAIGTFGFSLSASRTVPDLVVAVGFVLFLARPSVGALFSYRRSLKKVAIAMATVVALIAAANVYMYVASHAYEIPMMKRVAYESLDDAFYLDGYTRTGLPLGYSIALPGRHELLALARAQLSSWRAQLSSAALERSSVLEPSSRARIAPKHFSLRSPNRHGIVCSPSRER